MSRRSNKAIRARRRREVARAHRVYDMTTAMLRLMDDATFKASRQHFLGKKSKTVVNKARKMAYHAEAQRRERIRYANYYIHYPGKTVRVPAANLWGTYGTVSTSKVDNNPTV